RHYLESHACIDSVHEGETIVQTYEHIGRSRFPHQRPLHEIHPWSLPRPLHHRGRNDGRLGSRTGWLIVSPDAPNQRACRTLTLQVAIIMGKIFATKGKISIS